jgi:SAM-dependent methyltransferase
MFASCPARSPEEPPLSTETPPAPDPAVIPFEKRRFRTAAGHYLQGRPAYAPALIDRLVQLTSLGRDARVLDLGCGPGQLALALAPHAGEVVAVDPEPEMLRIAAENAAAAGLQIRFVEGSSGDIGPELGRFHLAVIGRAFHWMDRPRTLQRLDGLIEPGGAVALLRTRNPELPENAWAEAFDGVIERYAVDDEARRQRKAPGWLRHEAILLNSSFSRIEFIAVLERRQRPVERFIDRALSLSSTSSAKIGERTADLAAELRTALAPFAVDGMISEVVESGATIAWRPLG